MTTDVPIHAPVIALLAEQGIAAEEVSSGGNNDHVAWDHPSGGHFLADANDGWWRVGVYIKPDQEDDWHSWAFHAVAMHDSDLDEDADPALVVAWLLEVTRAV